jgi:hypothetical protein
MGQNLTLLQVWDAFEGEHLFTGRDPEHNAYRGRAHLSEMIALLGPPPPSLLACAGLRSKFFSEESEWKIPSPIRSGNDANTLIKATSQPVSPYLTQELSKTGRQL